jgi:uncharacterized protein (DUF608 family)
MKSRKILNITGIAFVLVILFLAFNTKIRKNNQVESQDSERREFNCGYTGEYLNKIAFPVGGIGAGMFCIEGSGAISHMSVRNHPDIFNEPCMFAAVSVKGIDNGTKILEGPVPEWKIFGQTASGKGSPRTSYGFPRFEKAEFISRFPFCQIKLRDENFPLQAEISGWSPFIPSDADNSSLPVGALEYHFTNTSKSALNIVFSYNSKNFMAIKGESKNSIRAIENGFILSQDGSNEGPEKRGDFAIFSENDGTIVDHCWYRGDWWNGMTMTWKIISKGEVKETAPVKENAPGASLYIPFTLKTGEEKTIKIMMAWYVPNSRLRTGDDPLNNFKHSKESDLKNEDGQFYKPWYSGRFNSIYDLASYWRSDYQELKKKSELFSNSFYNSTLPGEVMEAVAANMSILKSTTLLRQVDGSIWGWEGSDDLQGYCPGSCTHVWNYSQSICHLFPSLERSLRMTEFFVSQDSGGHQMFRSALPIRPLTHDFFAASDGQLGGIMKVYRDWRISGDDSWLKKIFPKVKTSLDYCIKTWDPEHKGVVEEPHLTTYDIDLWGPDGMNTSMYLGALNAYIKMGSFVGDDMSFYQELFNKGKQFTESELFNGEYFIQKTRFTGLHTPGPIELAKSKERNPDDIELLQREGPNSEEDLKVIEAEGPKYQYGDGCLADGVLGCWLSHVCGLDDPLDDSKVKTHLLSVYKYNFRHDLSFHSNPQRAGFALGHEGGLLVCTWPKGDKPSMPIIYCDEVWTGIEYQVASHLFFMGEIEKGLDIVRTCRSRYNGKIRNPFDEYEAGHWYARAMSSYALLEGLTGVRYDAVDRTLYINSKVGDFTSFLSTETGFGNVGISNGKPFIHIVYGKMDINKVIVSGMEVRI